MLFPASLRTSLCSLCLQVEYSRMELLNVIKRPIITEKSIQQAAVGKYTFEVDKNARKKDVARAVSAQFGVEVYRVTIMNKRGKTRRVRKTGQETVLSVQRKAIVTVNPQQKIEIFEVGEKE